MELHANTRVKPRAVRLFESNWKCKWPQCREEFTNLQAYRTHIENHRGDSYLCLLCNGYVKTRYQYLLHIQSPEHLAQGRRKPARSSGIVIFLSLSSLSRCI